HRRRDPAINVRVAPERRPRLDQPADRDLGAPGEGQGEQDQGGVPHPPPLRGRVGWEGLRVSHGFRPPTLPSPARGEGFSSSDRGAATVPGPDARPSRTWYPDSLYRHDSRRTFPQNPHNRTDPPMPHALLFALVALTRPESGHEGNSIFRAVLDEGLSVGG